MKILGIEFGRPKSTALAVRKSADDVAHYDDEHGGWWPVIREGFAGAWQQNITMRRETMLAFTAVYACVKRISQDIGKMRMCLKVMDPAQHIWVDAPHASPYIPLLCKPNDYQTRIQFLQQWMISKLLNGNAYILLVRDNRNMVKKMYPLDPQRVRPLITPDGSIYYELGYDPLSEVEEIGEVVPASEIIHDRMPGFFHPLIGTSPIFACGLAAAQGHSIQKSMAALFKNMAQPGGVLTAPGSINDDTAERLKKRWQERFTGKGAGGIAVLGDGLKFESIAMNAVDAQVIEQLKWSAETVCAAFDMPAFIVGFGPLPAYNNIGALKQMYYSSCLQTHVEDIEELADQGLGLATANSDYTMGVELDIDVVLRMDPSARYTAYKEGISGGFLKPNEARNKEDLPNVVGGDTPYMQQQNFSLAALAKRDALDNPFASTAPKPAAGSGSSDDGKPDGDQEDDEDDDSKQDGANKELTDEEMYDIVFKEAS